MTSGHTETAVSWTEVEKNILAVASAGLPDYTQITDGQRGLMRDILDYIANCMNEGDPPPPEFKEAFDASKTFVPYPTNLKTASEMRDEAESYRQMERFWEKVLLADIAIGAVLLRPPLPLLGPLRWLVPALSW